MSTGDKDELKKQVEPVKQTFLHRAKGWGDSAFPPTLLAALIFPLHARPFQPLPMAFPPLLLFTSYLNLQGYKTDAAGTSAAWSAIYMLLAMRRGKRERKELGGRVASMRQAFGTRGLVRGAAMGVAAVNVVAGGVAFALGDRKREKPFGGDD